MSGIRTPPDCSILLACLLSFSVFSTQPSPPWLLRWSVDVAWGGGIANGVVENVYLQSRASPVLSFVEADSLCSCTTSRLSSKKVWKRASRKALWHLILQGQWPQLNRWYPGWSIWDLHGLLMGGPIGKVVILNRMQQAMEKSGGVISRPRLGIGEALNQLLVSVEPTSASNLALPLILSCVNQKSNRSWSIRFWRWCWEVSWRSNRLILFASRVIVGWKTDSSPIRLEYSVCGFYVM